MTVADIELIVTRTAGTTTAALRVELPNRRADLAAELPITLDELALRAVAHIPDAYGAALTAMLFQPGLCQAWQHSMGFAEGSKAQLRLRLHLRGDDGLHGLRWELLRDPINQRCLARSERVSFSRFLSSAHLGDTQAPAPQELRALVAVSSAAGLGLGAVDVAGEVQRATAGLGAIPTTILDGRDGRPAASLAAIAEALRAGPHLLYLVCHGTIVRNVPYLWLEPRPDEEAPLPGAALIEQIAAFKERPLLTVLAACRSAGDGYATLAAVGPQLARAGIGAVLAMQGDVPMPFVAQLMPYLFAELQRDGQIDRALAAARAALPAEQPWWQPVLWMAVKDGALWRTPPAAVPGAGVFQVPYPPNPLFRGRDAELAALAQTLLGAASTTAAVLPALSGTGGIGKTQLASEFAHRHRDAFPGGVFWLAMEQPDAVAAQVAAAGGPGGLNLPGWSKLDRDGKIAAVRQAWTEPTRRLLVFDNLEEPQLLQDWRPSSGGSRVLVTTRRGVWAATSGVQAVRLQTLARPESVRLLLAPRYAAQVEAQLADPTIAAEADAICEQVGDLPLALALAGAYLEQTPSLSLAGYRARLAEQLIAHPSLEATLEEGLPTRHASSVRATIALSYQRLDATQPGDGLALSLLQRAAQLAPAPIPRRLLVRLAGRDPDDEAQAAELDAPLRRLAAVGLLELLSEGAVLLHRLVAAFVRAERAEHDPMPEVIAALDAELTPIYNADLPLPALPFLPHLAAAVERAGEAAIAHVAELLPIAGYLLAQLGERGPARAYLERAVQLREQDAHNTGTALAFALHQLGQFLLDQGDYAAARAHFERVLVIEEQALPPNHPSTATTLHELGRLLLTQGDYAAARPFFERALAIYEQALPPSHPDTAVTVWSFAVLAEREGDRAQARRHYQRALAIYEQVFGPEHDKAQRIRRALAALDAADAAPGE